VTFQQVQKYEKGQNRITAGRLRTVARLLEVPVSAFFEDDGGGEAVADGDSPLAFLRLPGAGELLHAYAGLTPEVHQIVLTLARDLAKTTGRGWCPRPGLCLTMTHRWPAQTCCWRRSPAACASRSCTAGSRC